MYILTTTKGAVNSSLQRVDKPIDTLADFEKGR